MTWNFINGVPIYTQIINEMTMRIASGVYEPGGKLPSVRDLAMDAGVNPNTMQRAMAELERRGLVFSELARIYFEEFADKLHRIGMTDEEIADSIRRWLNIEDKGEQ